MYLPSFCPTPSHTSTVVVAILVGLFGMVGSEMIVPTRKVKPALAAEAAGAAGMLVQAPVAVPVGFHVSQSQAVQPAPAAGNIHAVSVQAPVPVVVQADLHVRQVQVQPNPAADARTAAVVRAQAPLLVQSKDQNAPVVTSPIVASPHANASAMHFLASTAVPAAPSIKMSQFVSKAHSVAGTAAPTASIVQTASDEVAVQDSTTFAIHAAAVQSSVSAASAAVKSAASVAEAATSASAATAKAASATSASAMPTNVVPSVAVSSSEERRLPNLATPNTVNAPSWFWYWMQLNMPQTARFLEAITFALIIKSMCMAGNVLVHVSPYPQAKCWERRGCTGEVDAAPYVSIAFGGWQWCFYGIFAYIVTERSGFLVLVHSNCLGAILGTYYTLTFYRNCRNAVMLNSLLMYLSAVVSLVVLQIGQLFVLPPERALFLTGLVSSFCSFVGAMSMLVPVPTVLRTQDGKAISGPLVCANFASAIVWCICGYILQDLLVAGPNCFAALSSLACIFLKFKYRAKEDSFTKDANALAAMLPLDGRMKMTAEATEFTPLVATALSKTDAFSMSLGSKKGLAPDVDESAIPEATLRHEYADGTGGTC